MVVSSMILINASKELLFFYDSRNASSITSALLHSDQQV